ncbi:MAG: NAD(P)/FAD-dependent oxidoreductase [Hoeflea sp.]|uniref:FAD-dependent oxidoreductase n=1 Tax=Hoeflea sp. TaxID=1940281 RepID=UPI0032EEA8DE
MTHVLISGAGPVGLSAAIACRQKGMDVTIIDRGDGATTESRAVGISFATLDLLAASGAADLVLNEAERVRMVRVSRAGRKLTEIRVPGQTRKRPFLVALPQSRTEQILEEVAGRLGVGVRRGTELHSAEIRDGKAVAGFGPRYDGEESGAGQPQSEGDETLVVDAMFGAEGSHGATREALGIAFPGKRLPGEWSLADIECDWPFAPANACVDVHDDGTLIFIITTGGGRYRCIANHPDVVARASGLLKPDRIISTYRFAMEIRLADRFGEGPIAIGGDAAHVHTPVGGQGMNFGIADAFAFADAVAAGDLEAYRTRRRRIDGRMVRLTTAAYHLASARTPGLRMLRNAVFRIVGYLTGLLVPLAPSPGRS